jgi:glycosyltransferase involved in cell wall biosynthesis
LKTNPNEAVSVVIATHDRPEMLPKAVQSVLEQTRPVDEILVVDDASNLSAESVLAAFGDRRIRHLRHDTAQGGPAARNTGLAAVTSPYVAFLDDDDTWARQKIEKQFTVFEHATAEVGGVFSYACKLSPIDPAWRQLSETPSLQLGHKDFLQKTYFGTSVPLLRTEYVVAVGGFDESLESVQDRDLWLRLARDCSFKGVPEVLVWHYIHGDQITTDLSRKIAGREQFLKKHQDELALHPPILAMHHWRLGLMYCLSGNYYEGQDHFRQSLLTDPSCQGPAEDLRWSTEAPVEHADYIARERFNRIGDLILYY